MLSLPRIDHCVWVVTNIKYFLNSAVSSHRSESPDSQESNNQCMSGQVPDFKCSHQRVSNTRPKSKIEWWTNRAFKENIHEWWVKVYEMNKKEVPFQKRVKYLGENGICRHFWEMQWVAGMTDMVIWEVESLLSQTTNDLERQTGYLDWEFSGILASYFIQFYLFIFGDACGWTQDIAHVQILVSESLAPRSILDYLNVKVLIFTNVQNM